MKSKGYFDTTLMYVIAEDINNCCDDYETTVYRTSSYNLPIRYDLYPEGDDSKISLEFYNIDTHYYLEIDYFSGQNYEIFYKLLYKRFGDKTDSFGTMTETFDGVTSCFTQKRSTENVINSIVYALKEMFICIRQIVKYCKENTSPYCLMQKSPEEACTYEEYVHNVACKVIIQSNYYVETLPSFCSSMPFIDDIPREFCSFLIE